MNCVRCDKPMRTAGETDHSVGVRAGARGLCGGCVKATRKDGTYDDYPAKPTQRAAWDTAPCEGKCGVVVRRARLLARDYPGTRPAASGQLCFHCASASGKPTPGQATATVEQNRASLDAWHIRKARLAYGAFTRKVTRGIGVRL